jgi:GNAT superfamily N-acetyltransferase
MSAGPGPNPGPDPGPNPGPDPAPRCAIERVEAPGHEVEEAILAALLVYNEAAAGPARYQPVALVLRDPATGTIAGGLWADMYYEWSFVKLLVVPESLRGSGYGTRLMQQAETIARDYGATGIWLDTFSFQARGFYEKLGFTCFATLDDYPRGGSRSYMQKRF